MYNSGCCYRVASVQCLKGMVLLTNLQPFYTLFLSTTQSSKSSHPTLMKDDMLLYELKSFAELENLLQATDLKCLLILGTS